MKKKYKQVYQFKITLKGIIKSPLDRLFENKKGGGIKG